jgi:hypothetical protein
MVVPPVSCDREERLSPAAEIFVRRARATGRAVEFIDSELDDIHEICRRLDGVPLAIELAAGRLGGMSVSQVRSRLDDRFALLISRGSPEGRQRSLESAIEWSFDLLTSDEQQLLVSLSVFVGGFDCDAAVAVASPDAPPRQTEDLLASLVERSLMTASDRGSLRRFGVLESVREFAATRLERTGGSAIVRQRHLDYFQGVARELNCRVRDRDELAAHRAMMDDWNNLRAAFASACEFGDGVAACQLISDVLWWSLTRRRTEVADWAARAMEVPSSFGHPARTVVLAAHAFFTYLRGSPQQAAELLAQAREHESRHDPLAEPWISVVETFWADDQLATTLETQRQARLAGSRFWETVGILQEAVIRAYELSHNDWLGTVDRESHLDRINVANTMAADFGNPNGIAYGAANLGEAISLVDPDRGEQLLSRAIETAIPLGLGLLAGQARRALALLWLRRHQPADALGVLASALQDSLRSGSIIEVGVELEMSSDVCAALGLVDLAEAIQRQLGTSSDGGPDSAAIVDLARRVIAADAVTFAFVPRETPSSS